MPHPLTPREKVRKAIIDVMKPKDADITLGRVDTCTDAILTALASGSGDHDELARLAEDATPGPWEATGTTVWREEAVPIPVTVCCGNGLPSGECCGNGVEDCEWDRTQGEIANAGSNDAAFIAAANPAVVLALLAENAALREKEMTWIEVAERSQEDRIRADARATEAERKLAEAVGLLRKFHDAWRSGCGWLPSMNALDDEITAFLSKEAERG